MPNRRPGGLGVLLLATQLFSVGHNNVPPVTLILILGQVAIFLDALPQYFPSSTAVCMSSYLVWYHSQWRRLFLSAFYHADDMHLYFNMVSLLWKGMMLEKKFRSTYFAYLVAVFTAATSLMYVGLNMALEHLLEDHSYSISCAVGFSGVLFALKVLTTHYTPSGRHYALGYIPVPSKMVYWVELLLIQLVTPRASFVGHLAGILVGLAYVNGPLKFLMDVLMLPEPSYQYTSHRSGYGGSTGYRSRGHTYQGYSAGLSEEEQYRQAMEASLQDRNRLYPDLDELRARRAQRFS